jgi:hypothetical protein
VGASSPGKAAFTARALRSISGRVLIYDAKAAQYVPVVRSQVSLRESTLDVGRTTMSDPTGRYLFRDLAKGSYTVSVPTETQTSSHTVRLGDQPADVANVDFQITRAGLADVPPPAAIPAGPQPLAIAPDSAPHRNVPAPVAANSSVAVRLTPAPPVAVKAPILKSAAAQQHNILGRQLSKAGHYREAIAELTAALVIDPDFALAYNARAFALVMLRDWSRAIEDLNHAIQVNPNYGDAYKIRAVARKAVGDSAGAAADLARTRELAH